MVYLCAEGYLHWGAPDFWLQLATGKSILGGLLGGYAAVELAKSLTGYREVTGDWFALVVPVGIILGRVGCWVHGCCQGIECSAAWYTMRDAAGHARWPAVPAEIGFNLVALAGILWLHKTKRLPGQHFHLYLVAYGIFRFLHEFVREEPRVLAPLTGYQVAALVVLGLGVGGFIGRCRRQGGGRPVQSFEIEAALKTKSDQRLIDEALASGPEEPLTRAKMERIRKQVLRSSKG